MAVSPVVFVDVVGGGNSAVGRVDASFVDVSESGDDVL